MAHPCGGHKIDIEQQQRMHIVQCHLPTEYVTYHEQTTMWRKTFATAPDIDMLTAIKSFI